MREKTLYLIDGSGYIFRAYHALPSLTRPDGTPVGAVYGFTNMLVRLLTDAHADYLGVIFDAGRKTFRQDLYPEYKAHRPPVPEDLIPQFSLIRETCDAFNVARHHSDGFEADDLIATYAKKAAAEGFKVVIVSSDKDLMQLVNESITMWDPIKNRPIGPKDVFDKFGVLPEKVIDVQSLAGDATDNIPGVPGIGVKTAAQLIIDHGSLETLLENAGHIPQPKRREKLLEHQAHALISKQLVTLKDDVPNVIKTEDFFRQMPKEAELEKFLQAQNFTKILTRLRNEGVFFPPQSSSVPQTCSQNYITITTLSGLENLLHQAKDQGVLALDTETTSLDPLTAKLVGISMCVQEGTGAYIPLGHQGLVSQLSMTEVLDLLQPILENPGVLKVGHNLKYDMHILSRYGVHLTAIDDTMVMSYILDGTQHSHSLESLADHYFGHKMISFPDVAGKGSQQKTFDFIDIETATHYAAEDADFTFRLWHILKTALMKKQHLSIYETIDRPLITVLQKMESVGVGVHVEVLEKLSHTFAQELAILEKQAFDLVGHPFNLGSPKQLGDVLFQELNLPSSKKGKSGAYSTGAKVLEDLAAEGHLIAKIVLKWRELSKLKSTYTDSLPGQVNPETGRIHTSFRMTSTITGRLSSQKPNLQNIPIRTAIGNQIRSAFIAAPGHQLVSFDYSQIELRLLAHMANIPSLVKAFHEGKDIHSQTASDVFNVPLDQVTKELRSRAKTINFGVIYGISAFGLAQQLQISRQDAKTFIETYFSRYPGITNFIEKTKERARENGYVETIFGRKCYLEGLQANNHLQRSFAERQAVNAPLQGSAADIIKKAMNAIDRQIQGQGRTSAKLLLQIHDELIFEVADEHVEDLIQLVRPKMSQVAHLKVPLTVDCHYGKTWADIK